MKYQKINQKGFTLIEVMVVVAIIGILVAVAVPQYQDYIARGRVVEGLNLASSAKLAVTEAYATKGPSPMDRATQEAFSFTATRSVKEIEILANGAIAIDYQTTVAPDGKNSLILISSSIANSLLNLVDFSWSHSIFGISFFSSLQAARIKSKIKTLNLFI